MHAVRPSALAADNSVLCMKRHAAPADARGACDHAAPSRMGSPPYALRNGINLCSLCIIVHVTPDGQLVLDAAPSRSIHVAAGAQPARHAPRPVPRFGDRDCAGRLLLPEGKHLERRILVVVVCAPVIDRERLPDRRAEQLLQLLRQPGPARLRCVRHATQQRCTPLQIVLTKSGLRPVVSGNRLARRVLSYQSAGSGRLGAGRLGTDSRGLPSPS